MYPIEMWLFKFYASRKLRPQPFTHVKIKGGPPPLQRCPPPKTNEIERGGKRAGLKAHIAAALYQIINKK
jgi:hypothetical protein